MKDLFDLNSKKIELGHIVAVRYVWNSYVGIIRGDNVLRQLSLNESAERFAALAPFHSLEENSTFQILGHIDITHPDYNEEVAKWLKSEEGDCPVEIQVYSYDKQTLKESYS